MGKSYKIIKSIEDLCAIVEKVGEIPHINYWVIFKTVFLIKASENTENYIKQ